MTRRQKAVEKARARAKKGAEYLDKKFGSKRWARDIKLKQLDLNSSCYCVRGQLEKVGRIGDHERLAGVSSTFYPPQLGMHAAGEYGEQQEAWEDEIRARRR